MAEYIFMYDCVTKLPSEPITSLSVCSLVKYTLCTPKIMGGRGGGNIVCVTVEQVILCILSKDLFVRLFDSL
jgi:hypothetical protein